MAKSNNQKGKILYLEKMMRKTGENCVITMQEILAELLTHEIRAERKSIYDDIEVLRSFGMDIKYRRGRPGGYYLAGQTAPQESQEAPKPQGSAKLPKLQEPAKSQEPDREAWKKKKETCSGKQMKLRCSDRVRQEVQTYLGKNGEYAQKNSGCFTVSCDLLEGAAFYGWLVSMGKDVHILKPRKAAQNYREYLKALAREYKGV